MTTTETDPSIAAQRHKEEEIRILDVREPDEWNAGHIPGAIHIPLGDLEDRLADVPIDRPIVAACRSGARSAKATALLAAHGIDVSNLTGGTAAWHEAGLPLDPPDGHVA